MKRLIIILMAAILTASMLCACGEKSDSSKATADSAKTEGDTTVEEKETTEVFEIKTDYCTLKYPKKWKEQVSADIENKDVYTVKFSCSGTPLFDVSFNGGNGNVVGTIKGDTYTVVLLNMYSQDKKAENYNTLTEMCSGAEVLMNYLAQDYDFARGEALSKDPDSVFQIKTKLTTLYYPKKFEKKVTVDVNDDAVKFTCDKVKLFDLVFGGEGENLIGTYKDTKIYVVLHDIEKGSLSDYEYGELLEMKEAINVIIDHLKEDKNFKIGE